MRRKDCAKARTLSWDARSQSMTVASPAAASVASFVVTGLVHRIRVSLQRVDVQWVVLLCRVMGFLVGL